MVGLAIVLSVGLAVTGLGAVMLGLPGAAQADALLLPAVTSSEPSADLTNADLTNADLTNTPALEAFLDQFFATQMQAEHIPGAAVVLVKEGKLLFAKGYGYADLEQQRPVHPEQTVFRVGSISKLFTATAVMQLVEQGKLGLDDDVNQHLKRFQLESTYPQPVTVAQLLTHTGGLDERFIGIAARRAAEIQSPGDYLAEHLPARVLPPDTVIRYSNHGFVLAGYLVELASGLPFTQFINQAILQPLTMQHSSFQLTPDILANLATGYQYQNGTYQAVPMVYSNDVPSAALNTTAIDMANFMIAHLENGRFGTTQLLQPATIQEMHQQQFTNHPDIPGQAYGFYEWFQNGQRGLMHDGEVVGYKSALFLLPDQDVGWFVAYNNEQGTLQDELSRQLLDRYYPALGNLHPPEPLAGFQERSHAFAGRYRYIRYPRRTIDKLAAILPGSPLYATEFQVTAAADHLTIGSSQFVEVEPLLFRQVDRPVTFRGLQFQTLGFKQSRSGQIADLSLGKYAFEKLRWYDTATVQLGGLALCLLVFLVAGLKGLAPMVRAHTTTKTLPKSVRASDHWAIWAQRLAGLVCVLNLGFVVGFVLALLSMNLYEFAYGMPAIVIALLGLPLISAALTVALPIAVGGAWHYDGWAAIDRWHYLLVTVAAWGFIGFLNNWNLLGFRF
jgi:CubicO group peptidase (beta-lactamase class C family)